MTILANPISPEKWGKIPVMDKNHVGFECMDCGRTVGQLHKPHCGALDLVCDQCDNMDFLEEDEFEDETGIVCQKCGSNIFYMRWYEA